jgi:hypothetical protein
MDELDRDVFVLPQGVLCLFWCPPQGMQAAEEAQMRQDGLDREVATELWVSKYAPGSYPDLLSDEVST